MRYEERDAYAIVLGKVIAHLRQKRSWTQGQLADRVELQQSTISRIEGGTLSPDAYTLRQLAEAFELTQEELMRRVDVAYERTQQTARSATGNGEDGVPWWQMAMGLAGIVGLAGLAAFAVAVVMEELEREKRRQSKRRV